jgi:hypothetical protein
MTTIMSTQQFLHTTPLTNCPLTTCLAPKVQSRSEAIFADRVRLAHDFSEGFRKPASVDQCYKTFFFDAFITYKK